MSRFIFRNSILIVKLLCKGFERVAGNNKMKLLYGTGNLAKLSAMRNQLEQLDIELIGLNDLRAEGKIIPKVIEDGNTPLENARLKAMAYYEAFPVFAVYRWKRNYIQNCYVLLRRKQSLKNCTII